jgi:hypothetical protein
MIIKIVKNTTSFPKTWSGKSVAPSGSYQIEPEREASFAYDETLIADLSSGDAILSNGIEDYSFIEAKKILKATGGVIEEMTVPFNKDSQMDYVYNDDTTYAVVGNFIFKGTAMFEPTTIKIITSRSAPSAQNAYFKLYDFENDQDIAEIVWTDDEKNVQTTLNINNLPLSSAIFEVLLKTDDVASEARLHTLHLF